MTQTDRVYTSNRKRDTAQECINIDMLKLLKNEIAFVHSELSRELRSNQKTIEQNLLEQNSHYQTHQRRCDEFQQNTQNQSISYKNCQNKWTQFETQNPFTAKPSKSLLKSGNTTNVPIIIGNENTALEVSPGNGKENIKSIKVKEKVILVVDSIASGVNKCSRYSWCDVRLYGASHNSFCREKP